MRKSMRAVVVVLLALSLGVTAQAVELKLKLDEGEAYVQKLVQETTTTQTMMGQQVTVKQDLKSTIVYRVVEKLEDGSMNMEFEYTKIRTENESPQGVMVYDSEDPPETLSPQMKPFAAMLGKTVTFNLAPDGEVTDMQGMDAIMDDIVDAMAGEAGANEEEMREQLKGQFGDGMMRQTIEQSFQWYPEGPVSGGDTWSRQMAVKAGLTLIMNTDYTLKALQNGNALIDISGTFKSDPDAEPMRMGPMEMRYDLSGQQEGDMVVDVDDGITGKTTLKQSASGMMNMKSGGQNMEVPLAFSSRLVSEMEEHDGE